MKKQYIIAAVLFSATAYSQVGINTEIPKTTLDVTAKRDTSGNITDHTQLIGLQAPRLTRAELTANTATYGTDQKGALIYITDIAGGTATGQRANIDHIGYYYFDGTMWQKFGDTEVDGVIGNEVTNATANGGLTRAGGGTAASPYTLGLTSGTTAGDLMTWDGTQWLPTAAVNIYNSNGSLTGSGTTRNLTLNGKTLNFIGTQQRTSWDTNGVLWQENLQTSGSSAIVVAGGNSSSLYLQQFYGGDAQIQAAFNSTGLILSTSGTTVSAPISFSTSAGASALGTEKMRITGEGNVGINTFIPTEKLDNNGITRLRTLPLNGATNATNTTSGGDLSSSQNQTFTATKTLVADANGVIGYVSGLPVIASTGTINVGETVSQIYSVPTATASASTFNLSTYVTANSLPPLPVLDGLQISLQGNSTTYYDPRIYNTAAVSQLVSFQSFATQVNENKTSLNNTLAAGAYLQMDSNNIVFWSTTSAEVETSNVQVQIDANTYRWYEFKWWCMEIGTTKKIFLSITRKA